MSYHVIIAVLQLAAAMVTRIVALLAYMLMGVSIVCNRGSCLLPLTLREMLIYGEKPTGEYSYDIMYK